MLKVPLSAKHSLALRQHHVVRTQVFRRHLDVERSQNSSANDDRCDRAMAAASAPKQNSETKLLDSLNKSGQTDHYASLMHMMNIQLYYITTGPMGPLQTRKNR